MLEVQASEMNQDGTITLKVGGTEIQFAKQSDLGAVKAAQTKAETDVAQLRTDLATSNTSKDESHQNYLKEKAAKETLETGVAEHTTTKTALADMETKMADLTKVSGESSTELTDRIRKVLTDGWKIDAEKIKDMPLADLKQTEATLILTGKLPAPANYDIAPGNGGSPAKLEGKSPFQLAQIGYEEGGKSK